MKLLVIFDFRLLLMLLVLFSFAGKAEKITVVTEYLAPYQMKNQDGSLGGFGTEVINALFKITGDQPDIQVLPWARAYRMAKLNKNTLIYSITRTQSREKLFKWIGAIKTEQIHIWGLKSKFSDPVSNLAQLKNYQIGVVRNSYAEKYLELKKFSKIHNLINDDQSIKMLFRKRIDLVIGDELTLAPRIAAFGFDLSAMIKLIKVVGLSADLNIAFNLKSDATLVKRYQQAFLQLKKSGKFAEIVEKWQFKKSHFRK